MIDKISICKILTLDVGKPLPIRSEEKPLVPFFGAKVLTCSAKKHCLQAGSSFLFWSQPSLNHSSHLLLLLLTGPSNWSGQISSDLCRFPRCICENKDLKSLQSNCFARFVKERLAFQHYCILHSSRPL